MKIENAIDFQNVRDQLRRQLRSIGGYNRDLNRMLTNIENMVSELSKIEVTARRHPKSNMTRERVDEINKAIDHLEKLILMAKLMM